MALIPHASARARRPAMLLLASGLGIPPFSFPGSFTSMKNEENTAYQEHCDDNRCEIYDEPVTQRASCIVFTIGLKRKLPDALNCWLSGVALGRPPFHSAVQIATGLDMP